MMHMPLNLFRSFSYCTHNIIGPCSLQALPIYIGSNARAKRWVPARAGRSGAESCGGKAGNSALRKAERPGQPVGVAHQNLDDPDPAPRDTRLRRRRSYPDQAPATATVTATMHHKLGLQAAKGHAQLPLLSPPQPQLATPNRILVPILGEQTNRTRAV
jgi:hypothetical protein